MSLFFFEKCVKFSAESDGSGENTLRWGLHWLWFQELSFFTAKYIQGIKWTKTNLDTNYEVREMILK